MLRVPKDDVGIEIMTSMELSEVPTGNNKSSAWAAFTLSSIAKESGQWVQHCTGRIRVKTAAPPKDAFKRISTDMDARSVPSSIWYKRFAELGLEYGPTFQPLSGIQADPSQSLAVAQVALATTKEIDARQGGASDYTLHPASLDAVFQLALVASYGGKADEAQNAFVPTEIDNMYIKNGITAAGGRESAMAVATARLRGLRSAHAKLQLLDPETDELVMNINNLRCVLFTEITASLSSSTASSEPEPFSSPYSRLVWRPDVRTIDEQAAARLFSPPVESLNDVWLFDKFDRLTTLYVVDIHENYAHLDQLKSAPSDIQHFMSWVGRRFQDDDQVTSEARRLSGKERRALIEVLAKEIGHVPDAKIAAVVFENIADILFQRRTGLDVMLKDGVLYDVYDHGFLTEGAYRQFNRFLDLYGHSEPNARILEVGAGTGGATRNVLRTLTGANSTKRYQDYTFTNISSGFLNTAREAYSRYGDMKYSVLDISVDPAKQGYEAAYDLVIGCECLHATPSITETLTHCRKLLRPSGKIIMIENTRTVAGHTLVMGHMSGYWDGAAEGRIDSPFLPLKDWDTALSQCGFAGAQLVLEDYPQPYATAHTIVSTAIEPTPSPSAGLTAPAGSVSSTVYLIHGQDEAAQFPIRQVAIELSTIKGLRVELLSMGSKLPPEIYATVGTPEKRRFLVEQQGIPDSHIFSSRDIAAVHDMVQATNGRGFNVILSTAVGELLHEAAATMLAPMARFVDLARLDVIKAESLNMDIFHKNATFTSFDLSIAEKMDPDLCPSLMRSVDAHIRSGTLSPISPVTTFHVSELDKAMPTLSKGTHLGKIVVTYEDDKTSLVKTVPPVARAIFRPDANYIVVGGFGTLGRSIVAFMASRGAKHLTVLARSTKLTREAARLVDSLSASGVKVRCDPCDIGDPKQVAQAVSKASAIQPIRGIVHAAMLLQVSQPTNPPPLINNTILCFKACIIPFSLLSFYAWQ